MHIEMTKRISDRPPPCRSDVRPPTAIRCRAAVLLFAVLLLAGCDDRESSPDYVARVGDQYLLEEDLQRDLARLPAQQDSLEARRQIIEQWVTSAVLHQEALRRGLQQEPDVQRLLRDSERSVLVNALVARLYEEIDGAPSAGEMQSYYERHREQLRLRESFVRVRYVETESRADAEEARRLLQQAALPDRDSVANATIDRLATDPPFAKEISLNYHPETRLFGGRPSLREALARLQDGQTAPVVETDSAYHVIQLAERVPSGAIPEQSWIEDELARRLVIQGRKQLYARQVQRLRNEALAREELEIK